MTGWQRCVWVHLLWFWDARELCLLQGGISGQYFSVLIRIYWTAAGIGCLAVFFLVLKLGVPVKKIILLEISEDIDH